MDRIGPAPHYLPHFLLKLENRKGWQKQAGYDGPRQGQCSDGMSQALTRISVQATPMRSINKMFMR